jgi:hypothetical protein
VSDKKEEPKLFEVVLQKDHTHAGKKCIAGSKIKVTEPDRDWLAAAEVIATPAPKEASAK